MSRWLMLLVSASLLVDCSPNYVNGGLQCNTANPCPPGQMCACDDRCYEPGTAPRCADMATSPDLSMSPATSDMATISAPPDMATVPAPPDMSPPPRRWAPQAFWPSCGGGSATAAGGALNLSIGGSSVVGRSTGGDGANATFGAFSTQIF